MHQRFMATGPIFTQKVYSKLLISLTLQRVSFRSPQSLLKQRRSPHSMVQRNAILSREPIFV